MRLCGWFLTVKQILKIRLTHFLTGTFMILLVFFAALEALSFVYLLYLPLSPSTFNENLSFLNFLFNIETEIFYSSAGLAPFFIIVFLFSWVIFMLRHLPVILGKRGSIILEKNNRKLRIGSFFRSALEPALKPLGHSRRYSFLLLAASLIFAFWVAVYPYLPSLNPAATPVGEDVPHYMAYLLKMDEDGGLMNVLSHAFFEYRDRPLSLTLMYLGGKMIGVSDWKALQYLPVLLGPLLVLAVYVFMLFTGFNRWAASTTAIFTAFSYHITMGMYGALFANWISLIFFYLFLGLLLRSLRTHSWRLLGLALLFQIPLLLTHSYTWEMTVGILFVFLLLTVLKQLHGKVQTKESWMLLIVLLICILTKVVKNAVSGAGYAASDAEAVASTSLSLENFEYLWHILGYSLKWEGISLMNPLMFVLASLGGVTIAFDDELTSRFCTACVLASAVPFIFGNKDLHARILYVLPVQVFSFIGLLMLISLIKSRGSSSEDRRKVIISNLLWISVMLVNMNFAIRCSLDLVALPW